MDDLARGCTLSNSLTSRLACFIIPPYYHHPLTRELVIQNVWMQYFLIYILSSKYIIGWDVDIRHIGISVSKHYLTKFRTDRNVGTKHLQRTNSTSAIIGLELGVIEFWWWYAIIHIYKVSFTSDMYLCSYFCISTHIFTSPCMSIFVWSLIRECDRPKIWLFLPIFDKAGCWKYLLLWRWPKLP